MKFLRFVAPASLCLAATVSGQDSPRPDAPPRPDPLMKIGAADPAQVKRQLEDLRAQLLNAQADARRAQRELAEKLRQQSETARGLTRRNFTMQRPDGGLDRRIFTYTIVGDSTHNAFVKTYGLDFVEADPVLRSQLDIPAGEGLVVVAVTPNSPADRSGIKEMDLIAKVDLQPVAHVAKARDLIAKGEKKSIYFDLYREGKPLHLTMDRPEPPAGSTTYWIGVVVAPVDATLRSHLGSLLGEGGLIVTEIDATGPAKSAGLQKNDILIKVDDQPIKTQAALTERVVGSEGKAIKIDLLRGGKAQSLALVPAKRTINPSMTAAPYAGLKKLEDFVPWTTQLLPDGMYEFRNGPSTVAPILPYAPVVPGQTTDFNAAARVEAEMKALTTQLDDLREAVGKLTKELAAAKQSKKDD